MPRPYVCRLTGFEFGDLACSASNLMRARIASPVFPQERPLRRLGSRRPNLGRDRRAGSDCNLRFILITLPPGGISEDVIVGEGKKGGLVLDGSVQLKIGSELFDLDEGDSFQFPSSGPHALFNIKGEPDRVVWIMSVLDSHI